MTDSNPETPRPGSYVTVNGLNMYYEIHGTGSPLVLLHGGLTSIDTSFGSLLPSLALNRQVIAVEQQGHGHTSDIDRPLTFEQMADDTAALLRHLMIEGADIVGYSDGGNVALGIAIRHPKLVHKLVVAGTNYNKDGLYPGILEGLTRATSEDMPLILREEYARIAPNPENWPQLVAKVVKQTVDFEGWQPEAIQSIESPALIMIGDSDIVQPEHAVQLYRLLPYARLAVLPDTDHWLPGRSEWFLSMITDFLDAPC